MKRYFLILLFSLLSFLPLHAKKDNTSRVFYTLPKTVISINVESIENEVKASPYSRYGKSLLGMTLPEKDSTFFNISKISITAYYEPDYDSLYSISLTEKQRHEFENLKEEGFIYERPISNERKSATAVFPQKVSAPSPRVKTNYDEARKAASKINLYRENRYNIAIGNTDATYSGEAMGAALKELHDAENELLSLFLPNTQTYTHEYSFDFVPSTMCTRTEAFCFSESLGVLSGSSPEGIPYYLEICIEEIPQSSLSNEQKDGDNSIKYRLPAICTVKVYCYEHVVCSLRVPVFQLGTDKTLTL